MFAIVVTLINSITEVIKGDRNEEAAVPVLILLTI